MTCDADKEGVKYSRIQRVMNKYKNNTISVNNTKFRIFKIN